MAHIHKFQMDAFNVTFNTGNGPVLAFQMQDDIPTIWIAVDEQKVDRYFHLLGTGGKVPDNWDYCGTVQERGFVWHLFEEPNK